MLNHPHKSSWRLLQNKACYSWKEKIGNHPPEECHTNPNHCWRLWSVQHGEHPALQAFERFHPGRGTIAAPWAQTSWHPQNLVLHTSFLQCPLPWWPHPCCTPSIIPKAAAATAFFLCKILNLQILKSDEKKTLLFLKKQTDPNKTWQRRLYFTGTCNTSAS